MVFWHIGGTIMFVRYAFRDEAMDLRYLALGSILPAIIDTPVGVAMWQSWQTPRLWAHSLLFGSIVMVAVLVLTRRGPRRKQWMLLSTGILMHLAFDFMWAEPETFWWPFLGLEFTPTGYSTFGAYVAGVLSSPWMWAGEAAGAAYLVHLWRASGLGDPKARRVLMSEGTVSAPISRT